MTVETNNPIAARELHVFPCYSFTEPVAERSSWVSVQVRCKIIWQVIHRSSQELVSYYNSVDDAVPDEVCQHQHS